MTMHCQAGTGQEISNQSILDRWHRDVDWYGSFWCSRNFLSRLTDSSYYDRLIVASLCQRMITSLFTGEREEENIVKTPHNMDQGQKERNDDYIKPAKFGKRRLSITSVLFGPLIFIVILFLFQQQQKYTLCDRLRTCGGLVLPFGYETQITSMIQFQEAMIDYLLDLCVIHT